MNNFSDYYPLPTGHQSLSAILQAMRPLQRRLRQRDSLKAAWMSLGAGLGLSVLLLLAGRIWPLLYNGQFLAIGLIFTLLLFLAGQLFVWLRPLSPQKLARLGDVYLHLDERLITALELSEGRLQASSAIRQSQLDDTFSHLQRASLSQALPLTARNRLLQIGGALLALAISAAALYLAPNPQEGILQQQDELADLLESEIAQLKEAQADLPAQADPLLTPQIEELSAELSDLIDRLESARSELSPEQAMAALSEAEESLTQLDQQRLAQQKMLDSLAESLAKSDLQSAQKAAEALQNDDFQQASEALQQPGQTPPATPAEAEALAETLSQAAQAVAQSNPELAQSLQQAANALQSGDAQTMQEAMQQAAQQLSQAGAQAAAGEALQQTLENIQQARQQLAQAGQGAGEQVSGGAGEQGGVGEQAGQGTGGGSGSGSGRGDPGAGEDGLYSVQGAEGSISTDNGPNQNRLEEYSSVYAPVLSGAEGPEHIGGQGGEFVVPKPQNPDGGGFDIGETAPSPNHPTGEALVPYTEVYQQYRNQAGVALDSGYIPLGMKDYVRQYFGALEP